MVKPHDFNSKSNTYLFYSDFLPSLINGDFAAGAVLISFGAIIGVASPLQLVTLCIIEVFLYSLNEYIGAELFEVSTYGSQFSQLDL
jgi:hypothetical protein